MFKKSFLAKFAPETHLHYSINGYSYNPNDFALFDHNGYDLTNIEVRYCESNNLKVSTHRHSGHVALKQPWFFEERTPWNPIGAHINHAAIFERKGYAGDALYQLREIAHQHPIAYKIINIQPKWGVDLSIDYVDNEGNCFEVLHFEYDVFNIEEANKVKQKVEYVVENTDWNNAARRLLVKKDEWMHLDFFKMSKYKCEYFGLPPEKFKETIWHGN